MHLRGCYMPSLKAKFIYIYLSSEGLIGTEDTCIRSDIVIGILIIGKMFVGNAFASNTK